MTNVACYVDPDECIAEGLHLTDCDDDGYCNHCGCQDGIEDPPVQRTFGAVVGMEPTLPIAPHPADQFVCEDTGALKYRADCIFSADGKAWEDEDERFSYDSDAFEALAKTLSKGCDDYISHDDSVEDRKHDAFNNDQTWREYVEDYYRDDCEDCVGHTEYEMEMICDELRDRADAVVKVSGYSDFDYDLTSWDVGEDDTEIMINDHPLLKTLYEREGDYDLEEMMDYTDGYHDFIHAGRDGKFVSRGDNPSITLRIFSNKTYWWGCSHETMEEVYRNIVDCTD
jgi:hypothetical protein